MNAEDDSQDYSPPWGLATKVIIASVALILGALVVWRFQFLLTPLAAAAILAYLLNPLVTWLAESMHVKRIYALLLLYGGILLIWSAGAVILGFVVADQVSRLRTVLPDLIPRLVEQVQTLSKDWSTTVVVIGPYRLSLDSIITPVEWSQIADQVRTGIQPIVSRSGVLVAEIAQATLSTLGRVLLVIVISIYISNDVPKLGAAISNIAHQPGYRYDADKLVHETLLIWNAYLRGQVLLALVIGVVVSIALTLLGVSNAIALGILSGVLEFLPIVGPVIGTVAAVLVAVFQSSNYLGLSPVVYGLIVLGVMIVIQLVENNVLVPRIVGDALDLHPIAIMVGVMMGASLAGLLGAILAAPLVATIKLFGVYVWRKLLDMPPFPDPEVLSEPPEPPKRGWRLPFSSWLDQFMAKRGKREEGPTLTEDVSNGKK